MKFQPFSQTWAGALPKPAYASYVLLLWLRGRVEWASEPEANDRGSPLIDRRLLYRGLQSLFLTKYEELWLWANGRFRMRSGMAQGIVVMREWKIKDAQSKMRDWTI